MNRRTTKVTDDGAISLILDLDQQAIVLRLDNATWTMPYEMAETLVSKLNVVIAFARNWEALDEEHTATEEP